MTWWALPTALPTPLGGLAAQKHAEMDARDSDVRTKELEKQTPARVDQGKCKQVTGYQWRKFGGRVHLPTICKPPAPPRLRTAALIA